jgi:hypothetical protein
MAHLFFHVDDRRPVLDEWTCERLAKIVDSPMSQLCLMLDPRASSALADRPIAVMQIIERAALSRTLTRAETRIRRTTYNPRLAVCVATVCSLGCSKPDSYRPVYYPDAVDLSRGPAFDNVAQANQWVPDPARQRRDPNWTSEIGRIAAHSMVRRSRSAKRRYAGQERIVTADSNDA